MAHLSVVIPVYEAETFLPELYRRLKSSLVKVSPDYEIVLVDDSSRDGSWEVIRGLARMDKRIKAVQLSRNFGQHYAITAGLDHCNGDWIVVMDCDLQDRPEEIPKLYKRARAGYDVVLALRMGRKDGVLKRSASWFFYKVFSLLTDLDYNGKVGNFSMISRKVAADIRDMRENLRFYSGMLKWVGFSVAKVPVQHAESARGKSSYTHGKLVRLALEAIISYSDKPLWMSIRLGFVMAAASILMAGYFFFQVVFHGVAVSGWASLIVSLYFLGGVIIGILGIVGIYVGKTFAETKGRPLYLVRDSLNVPRKAAGRRDEP